MNYRASLLLAVVPASFAVAQGNAPGADARFDGDWVVTMTCPNNTERTAARGYKRQLAAQVKAGVLHAETGSEGSPGWLRLDGGIDSDGRAVLDGHGRTSDSDYAVGHPPVSTPYAFHVDARFEAARGSGRRLEQRVCSFGFERK